MDHSNTLNLALGGNQPTGQALLYEDDPKTPSLKSPVEEMELLRKNQFILNVFELSILLYGGVKSIFKQAKMGTFFLKSIPSVFEGDSIIVTLINAPIFKTLSTYKMEIPMNIEIKLPVSLIAYIKKMGLDTQYKIITGYTMDRLQACKSVYNAWYNSESSQKKYIIEER